MTAMLPVREFLVDTIGRTLLHAVWQTALIAGLTAIVLACLRGRSPRVRYGVACAGLALASWWGRKPAAGAPAVAEGVA